MAQDYNDDKWFDFVNWHDAEVNLTVEVSNNSSFSPSTHEGRQTVLTIENNTEGEEQSYASADDETNWMATARHTPINPFERQKQAFLQGDFGGDDQLADAWLRYMINHAWPAPKDIDMLIFNQQYVAQSVDHTREQGNRGPAMEGAIETASTINTADVQTHMNSAAISAAPLEQVDFGSGMFGDAFDAVFSLDDFAMGDMGIETFLTRHEGTIGAVSIEEILAYNDLERDSAPIMPLNQGPFAPLYAEENSWHRGNVEYSGAIDNQPPHVQNVQHHLGDEDMGSERVLHLADTAAQAINNYNTINSMDTKKVDMSADEGNDFDQFLVADTQNDLGQVSAVLKEKDPGQVSIATAQSNIENLDADVEGNYPPKFDLMDWRQFKKIGAIHNDRRQKENRPIRIEDPKGDLKKVLTSDAVQDCLVGTKSLGSLDGEIDFGKVFGSEIPAGGFGGPSIKHNVDTSPPATSGQPPLKKRKTEVFNDENAALHTNTTGDTNLTTQDRSGQAKRLNKLQKQKLYAAMEDSGNLYTGEQIMKLLNTDPGPGRRNAIWVQRNPYNSTKLYNDSTKTWCRYACCEGVTTNATVNKDGIPVPKNHKFPRTIISGNYQVAIDTGYVYDENMAFPDNIIGRTERKKWKDRDVFNCNEAFFHLECFEKMVDFVGLMRGVYVNAQGFMDNRVLTGDRKWNDTGVRKPKGGTNPAEIEHYLKVDADRWVAAVRYNNFRPEPGSDGCLSKLLVAGKTKKNDKKNAALLSPALQKKLDGDERPVLGELAGNTCHPQRP